MHWPKSQFRTLWPAAAIACIAAAGPVGCASTAQAPTRQREDSAFRGTSTTAIAAARFEAMAAGDTYISIFVQAIDEMRERTSRDEVLAWGMEQRVSTSSAVYTNATGPNDLISLLDLMIFTTLKRCSLEEHWIPKVLHKEGDGVLEAARHGERYVWEHGAKVLSEPQCAELRELIEQWRREHPGQYYVAHIRFTDFSLAMKSRDPSRGSLLGLLNIDPLAGLDPVARELQQYRALSERMVYLVNRMPIVAAWQVDLAVYRTVSAPPVVRVADASQTLADAATQLTDSISQLPQEVEAERTAAIAQIDAAAARQVKDAVAAVDEATARRVESALDQAFTGITWQREALVRDITGEESRAHAIVEHVRDVVDRAADAGRSLNVATAATIDEAERSARRTLNYACAMAVGVVLAILVLLFIYRYAMSRWVLRPVRAHLAPGARRHRPRRPVA